MGRHASDHLAAARATLVLLHGAAAVKDRVIDHGAVVVGRGRGCDIVLEAPDVSTLHCVITKGSFGYHVRDCGSRAGTKVNGERIQESSLHDGDLILIGPFCFRLHVPAEARNVVAVSEPKLRHLERSRRNLARLALERRKQLHRQHATLRPAANGDSPSGLRRKSQALQTRVRDFDHRQQELDARERDLHQDRLQLEAARAAFAEECRQWEESRKSHAAAP